MIRLKKEMAALLILAMIATSFQMPVFAEEFTDESISVETTEAESEESTEISNETEVELGENLDIVYVYNAEELVSALNGKSSDKGDQERIKRGNYKIKLADYKELVTGKDSYKPWLLSVNEVRIITLDKRISEIDFCEKQITLDSSIIQNETDYFKLVIPKESEVTLKNTSSEFPWMIENQGYLVLQGDHLRAGYASAISNQGFLEIKDSYIQGNSNTKKGINLITNTGNMIVYSGKIYNENDQDKNENAVIYSLGGSVSINGGEVKNQTESGNAIYLSGKNTVATVRGTTAIHSLNGSAVINRDGARFIMNRAVEDGGHNLDIYNYNLINPTVYTYNEGITEVYAGSIDSRTYGDGQIVRTTPMNVNSKNTDGKLIMGDGMIGKNKYSSYGIVYKVNKPVLKNGIVYGNKAAVMKVSDNGMPDNVTTYQFENRDGKIVNAYEKGGGNYVALKSIEDGLYGLNGDSNNEYIDSVSVNTFEELKAAISSNSINNVKLCADITISGNLEFKKDFTIRFQHHTLIAPNMGDTITINEGKKISFSNVFMESNYSDALIIFKNISSNRAALVNRGELYLGDVKIEGSGTKDGYTLIQNEKTGNIVQYNVDDVRAESISNSKNGLTYALKNYGKVLTQGWNCYVTYGNYAVTVYNEGDFRHGSGWIDTEGSYSVALWNKSGTFEIENGQIYQESNSASSNAAVYIEGGKVSLQGEEIKTNSNAPSSHAIVYTENSMPILIGGSVTGAASWTNFSVSKNEPARGSAVVCLKDGKITTGSFINGNGDTVNSENAIYIQNGKIMTQSVAYSGISYLLMERGETILDMVAEMNMNGSIYQNYLTFNDYTLSSNNLKVLSVSDNKMAVTAKEVGYARLTFKWKGSGVTDSVRIEVVEKGKRATISANDYSGSLINDVEYVNAYQTSHDVAMEWHLTSSEETSTGGECDLKSAKNIYPKHVIIEDETFNKYFSYMSEIIYDKIDKKYHFTIMPVQNTVASPCAKLIEDKVSNIDNIEVKIQVTNENGVPSVKTIGNFNIVLQNIKPVITNKPIKLNSAFQGSNELKYFYNGVEQFINYGDVRNYLTNVSSKESIECHASEGIRVTDDGYFLYAGDGKIKKGNIHVKAEKKNYIGTYETDIPVKILKAYPSVTLAEKNITIAEDVAEMTDIKVAFRANNTFSLGTMRKVEILDKNSKFEVSPLKNLGGVYDSAKKGVYEGPYVYLQPKQDITKAQNVNLKVTYIGTTGVKGKDYSTNLTVTINPIKKSNFLIKLITKKPTLLTKVSVNNANYKQYGSTVIGLKTSPQNYKGGYFTVSNLDGTEVKGVSINKVTEFSPGNYNFTVYANNDIVNKTGKLDLYVTRYGNDGKVLGKSMKVTIKLIKETALVFKKKEVTMDVNSTFERMVTKVPIKLAEIEKWSFSAEDSLLFEVKNHNAKNILIQPLKEALYNGVIVPGGSYQLKLKGMNEIGEVVYQDITVKVNKSKITNNICDVSNLSAKKDLILYKSAPTTQQDFTIITENPYYGMFVKNVEITDKKSLFELDHAYFKILTTYNYFTNLDGDYDCKAHQCYANGYFRLCFKNGKVEKNIKKSYPVKIRITYENGQTVDKTIKVTVK